MIDYYSTADEIAESKYETVILPVGSTEQHGPHLPVHSDNIIVSALAERLAEKIDAVLLPTLPYSTCREHMGKKGSVWMNADTFYKMMWDICESLEYQGYKRIIILQGHGGIFVMTPFIRDFNARHDKIKIIRPEDNMHPYDWQNIIESQPLHSCEMETSLMLYLNEKTVRKDKIQDYIPDVPQGMLNIGSIFTYSPIGVWGKPSLATVEKGEKILNMMLNNMLAAIKEAERFLDMQTDGRYDEC